MGYGTLVSLVFHNLPSLYPSSFCRNEFLYLYTYLLGCLRCREKHVKDVCCCLQTCNSVLYVVVMGLVLGQSLMVISTTGILLYAKVSPFIMYYGSALLLFTRKVHCLPTFWQVTAH